MIMRKIVREGLFRDAIFFMLNLQFRLRPFLTAVFGVVFLSSPALAAREGSTDRPGLDYKTMELSAPNPDLCENACKKDGQCRAWTYSWPGAKGPKAMCALKSGVPPKRSDTCCISGVLSTTNPVTRTDDPAPAPTPAPEKPGVTAKPAPAPVPAPTRKKPVQTVKPLPEKPVVTVNPLPVPAPPAKKPVEAVKPLPEKPIVTVEPVPVPALPAKKPVEVVKPLPEKPADRVIVTPAPIPLPPVKQRETLTVTPKLKPTPSPVLRDEAAAPDTAKVAACNDYAARAIAQNNENSRLHCGLSGSRWGYGRTVYFNFCMRNPSSAYNGSRAARDRDLETCRRAIASGQQNRGDPVLPDLRDSDPDDSDAGNSRSARFCRNFAAQSIRQVRDARGLRCGFDGERWSSSRVRQAQLCARIGPRAATDLLSTRNRQIQNCRFPDGIRDGRVRSDCRDYARSAVEQAAEARRLDCGYDGTRWSRNYDTHLRWCNSVPQRKVRQEYRRRERLLNRCE